MSRLSRTAWLLAVVGPFVVTPAALSAPPVVVKAVPDNGDVDVDPSLNELRITFDQPMSSGGYSIAGGGDEFPEILGDPRWINPTTIVAAIKLKPNHNYILSINTDRFQNFKNEKGEPATPYPITFRTGAGDGKAEPSTESGGDKSEALTPTQNKRAINLLRAAILKHYSYRDRLKINWGQVISRKRDALIAAKSPEEFAKTAAVLLAQAQDKHLWFQVGDEHIPSYVRPQTPNVNFKLLKTIVPQWQLRNGAVATGMLADDIGYLWIGNWGKADDIQAALAFLEEAKDTQALVIDVRGNGGGNELLAREVAGCFVDKPVVYGQNVSVDPDKPGTFTPPHQRVLEPNQQANRYRGRVVVLTGPVVMSSCESFLLMMKQGPQTVLVGAKSQGSSGNPQPHDLENGVTVFLPSWKDMTAEGEELEGKGIAPDEVVAATPAEFQTADPVLARALRMLQHEE